ncbi:hypothetical protein LSAT2_025043 [Lamellibrachia satsuma]|nr:hypothetical protein LSAT2_025043 [Lamellibrachia satsuma]
MFQASCPDGRVWTKCRGACQPTCKKPFRSFTCIRRCVTGCLCPNDSPILLNGKCIREAQCKALCPDGQPTCKKPIRSFTCIRRCVTGCLCPNDSPILLNGKCIREAQCKALCPDGQVWSTCTAHCQPTCDKPRPICSLNCVRGCVCPEDRPFLHEGECIRQAQCPVPLECLETSRGFEYKGHKNKTATGRTCQAWHYQEPHKHSKCKPLYRNNYCTNMDNLERKCRGRRPWCYTMDPKKRWEYCAIPKCKVSCPEGRVWTKCKGRCRPTCKIPKPRCSRRCFSGCVCPTDSPFLHKGKCIKKAQCPVCNGQAGSRCVRSCVQDGNHQSCHGCNMYVTCNVLTVLRIANRNTWLQPTCTNESGRRNTQHRRRTRQLVLSPLSMAARTILTSI